MSPADRVTRDTDPSELSSSEMPAAARQTLPPEAITNTENQRPEIPPVAPAAVDPQPNPHSYSDFVLSELLENSRQLKADSAAFAANRSELASHFEKQTASIERAIAANYGLVKAEVVTLRTEHEQFRAELAELKAQLATLDALKAKVAELEQKIANAPGSAS